MGHYFGEIFPNGRDNSFDLRFEMHQKRRIEEFLEIISNNPIKIEDIKIGDKLELYSPLNNRSKFSFNNNRDCPLVKSIFNLNEGVFNLPLSFLNSQDSFIVYDIQTRKSYNIPLLKDIKSYWIRIDKPISNVVDWNHLFVPIKYFQKPQ